jgi:hypothetical protein
MQTDRVQLLEQIIEQRLPDLAGIKARPNASLGALIQPNLVAPPPLYPARLSPDFIASVLSRIQAVKTDTAPTLLTITGSRLGIQPSYDHTRAAQSTHCAAWPPLMLAQQLVKEYCHHEIVYPALSLADLLKE